MQCKKCLAEINTSGFRWSQRMECARCGALYEPDRVRNAYTGKNFWFYFVLYIVIFQIAAARKDVDSYFEGEVDIPLGTIIWWLCIAIFGAVEIYRTYRHKKFFGAESQWRYIGTKESLKRKRRRQFNLDAKIFLGVLLAAVLVTVVLFKLAY